jgi:hypothetical protein
MAYVYIDFHRDRGRVRPHIQYIADRQHSCGLRGLGQEFRQLKGDVEHVVRLFHEHAGRVRQHVGAGDGRRVREGPFHEMIFTLPTGLARRVTAAGERLPDGSERVLRDAIEAVFRSVGRHLQGVYAVHFNSLKRDEHPHVHVALSPLDAHGRTTFVTKRQRESMRAGWEREVVRALDRTERRGPVRPTREDAAAPLRSKRPRYVPAVTEMLLGRTGMPLLDLFLRALAARTDARRRVLPPLHAARYALGLPVPMAQLRPLVGVLKPVIGFTRSWLR